MSKPVNRKAKYIILGTYNYYYQTNSIDFKNY